MQKEKSPSLFLPVLTGILLLFIFLSGITEMACLASYAGRPDQTTKLNKVKTLAVTGKNVTANLQSVTATSSKPSVN